jgi:hypothetical protein
MDEFVIAEISLLIGDYRADDRSLRSLLTQSGMNSRSSSDRFPWWDYLNQPLFDSHQPFILNPKAFRRYHRVNQLERCWRQSEVFLLEHCWRQELDEKNSWTAKISSSEKGSDATDYVRPWGYFSSSFKSTIGNPNRSKIASNLSHDLIQRWTMANQI